MKTVRFSEVVDTCGRPVNHLVLTTPSKDRALQAAVKASKVMTVHQPDTGSKADRGEIGFRPGKSRQFLLFPKSLRVFAKHTVVGIKYDKVKPDWVGKA
jgi:hypothetical protein